MTKILESDLRQGYPRLAKMGQLGQHLVLHLDVNKTLVATDKAGGKPEVSMVVQEMLAERYLIFLDYETKQPISYYEHVKRLFPGDKRDPEVRANRFRLLHNFVEDYSLAPFGKTLRGEYDLLRVKLEGQDVFESFFTCMEALRLLGVTSSVALRTFGDDIEEVCAEITDRIPDANFERGRFRQGKLEIGDDTYSSPGEWMEQFQGREYLAVQDDFTWWESGQRDSSHGKPFPVDLGNFDVHEIFFDDNIVSDSIVAPVSRTGNLSTEKLIESGKMVAANTVHAILDDLYFLKKIEESLEKAEIRQTANKIVLLADPQFGFYDNNRGWAKEEAQLEVAIKQLHDLAPRCVVVCGDMTHASPGDEAYSGQLEALKKTMAKIQGQIPVFYVCGNHDLDEAISTESIQQYRSAFGISQFLHQVDDSFLIGINSSLLCNPEANPKLAAEHRQWLVETLKWANENRQKHIFIFQHILLFLEQPDERDGYFNFPAEVRREYLDLFKENGVDAVFCGHYHQNARGKDENMDIITVSAVGRPLGKDRPGFGLLEVNESGYKYEYINLQTAE